MQGAQGSFLGHSSSLGHSRVSKIDFMALSILMYFFAHYYNPSKLVGTLNNDLTKDPSRGPCVRVGIASRNLNSSLVMLSY